VAKKRARRKIRQLGGAPLGAVVFTFPPVLRDRIGVRQAVALRRIAGHVLRVWALHCWGLRVGGYGQLHPAGDREPWRWSPHLHLGFPLVGVDPAGGIVRLPLLRTPDELEALRTLWGGVLQWLALLWGVGPVVPNVNYAFRELEHEVAHRFRYDLRSWPEWSSGGLPVGAATPAPWGLAAPAAKDAELWRATVRGFPPDPPNERCPDPDCDGELEYVDTVSERGPTRDLLTLCHPLRAPP